MAGINGYSNRVQYVATGAPQVSVGGANPSATMDAGTGTHVIDGTPVRVVAIALAAAAGLAAFKLAGWRFNIGVST